MTGVLPVRRALLSVSDKEGIVSLARALVELGATLIASGSTARSLREAGVPVTPIPDVTGHPEVLGGRVKTLHPAVHGGILADRGNPEHLRELEALGIEPIDLVVANLYPFAQTVASGESPDRVVELIDIGGPALVRAAAKNFEWVGVVVRPARYDEVIGELRREGGLTRETRLALAREAFAHTAAYEVAIARWFGEHSSEGLPSFVGLALEKVEDLRYGENPHQRGALYRRAGGPGPLGGARVLQGKEMSFNNWLDAEAARALAAALPGPAAVIVKHHNPCGAAVGTSPADAYGRALACDPVSAFGGVVAFNGAVDEATARAMGEVFTEVVVAPAFAPGALEVFRDRRNLRLVQAPPPGAGGLGIRSLEGGALVQEPDALSEGRADMNVVTARQPSEEEWRDLLFAWVVAAHVRSNAIVLARDGATVGVGAGQMSRVDAVELACRKAGARARGSVMASDAFFPFPDGVERAAVAGVEAVIQPGGSVRDREVVEAAERHGMALVLTGRRHFLH